MASVFREPLQAPGALVIVINEPKCPCWGSGMLSILLLTAREGPQLQAGNAVLALLPLSLWPFPAVPCCQMPLSPPLCQLSHCIPQPPTGTSSMKPFNFKKNALLLCLPQQVFPLGFGCNCFSLTLQQFLKFPFSHHCYSCLRNPCFLSPSHNRTSLHSWLGFFSLSFFFFSLGFFSPSVYHFQSICVLRGGTGVTVPPGIHYKSAINLRIFQFLLNPFLLFLHFQCLFWLILCS